MKVLMALLSGALFGVGLILSGMTDPAKVLGFLDLAGMWDPSLACVMGGAVLVAALAFSVAARRRASLLGEAMPLPAGGRIDRRLVLGGLTFGVGWGMAGYCPGPAMASLAIGGGKPAVFVAAMLVGMALFSLLERARNKTASMPA